MVVESVESLLLLPFELVGVTGLTELHVNYVHMHGRRQAAAPELAHTRPHRRAHTPV